jgi:hemerythrin-like domain-containing protein
MSALKSLTDEHQMMVELLGALHVYATRLRAGASVDPVDLARFAEVLRELVDYRHHEKEEGILFPLLARNGFDWSEGLLAELRREHGHLRHLIDVLYQAAAKDAAVDESGAGLAGTRRPPSLEDRRQVADTALAFVELKRLHVAKEESVLFQAVRERLGARAPERLAVELAQFDEVLARHAGSSQVFREVAALVERYSDQGGSERSDSEGGDSERKTSEHSATVDVTGVEWTAAPTDARSLRRVS